MPRGQRRLSGGVGGGVNLSGGGGGGIKPLARGVWWDYGKPAGDALTLRIAGERGRGGWELQSH